MRRDLCYFSNPFERGLGPVGRKVSHFSTCGYASCALEEGSVDCPAENHRTEEARFIPKKGELCLPEVSHCPDPGSGELLVEANISRNHVLLYC